MKIGNTEININTNQVKADLTATHSDGTKLSLIEKVKLLIKHNPLVVIAIIYSISPIDIIPDFVPFMGSVDDTIILLMPMLKLFQETLNARAQISPTDTPAASDTIQPQIPDAINQPGNALNKLKDITSQAKNIYNQISSTPINTVETDSFQPEKPLPDLPEITEDTSDDSMPKLKSKFDDLF